MNYSKAMNDVLFVEIPTTIGMRLRGWFWRIRYRLYARIARHRVLEAYRANKAANQHLNYMSNYPKTTRPKEINDWVEQCDPIMSAEVKTPYPSTANLATSPRLEIIKQN